MDFGDKLEAMIGQYESGSSYDRQVESWLAQLPPTMIGRFVKWGLVGAERSESQREIDEHLTDWHEFLLNKGVCQEHADQNHNRAKRIFIEGGFRCLSDIKGDRVMQSIGQLQKTVKKRSHKTGELEVVEIGPAASFTKLHHLRACKQFTKWLMINNRLTHNPLTHLSISNVRVEKQRRSLSVDELSYLLAYVTDAPDSWNVPGPERVLIYELAVSSGLRRDEIKSLTRTSFDFKRLTVEVQPDDTKNKKPALLPVKAALMDKIKFHLSGKMPLTAAFMVPQPAAKMLQGDMQKARTAWIEAVKNNPDEHRQRVDSDFLKVKTHEGVADFHALRHTFGTLLAASGVHPKVAMDLMRHSDINLTMALYTTSNKEQATAAINSLPSFGKQKKRKKA